MSIHNDQKKSILNKLFKNGANKISPTAITNNYTTVNSSFNEQLMNQTNFGFNPARQTIVSTPNNTSGQHGVPRDLMALDTMAMGRDRRELNTQKRNRTQTIQIESPINGNMGTHQRGGSLNIQELYQHYQQKPKGTSVPSSRVNNHQAQLVVGMVSGVPQQMQNNLVGSLGSGNGINVGTLAGGSIDGVYLQNQ